MISELVEQRQRIDRLRADGRETRAAECEHRVALLQFLTPDWALDALGRVVRALAWWRSTLLGWRPRG